MEEDKILTKQITLQFKNFIYVMAAWVKTVG